MSSMRLAFRSTRRVPCGVADALDVGRHFDAASRTTETRLRIEPESGAVEYASSTVQSFRTPTRDDCPPEVVERSALLSSEVVAYRRTALCPGCF